MATASSGAGPSGDAPAGVVPDDGVLAEIEACAVELAREAGAAIAAALEGEIHVEYKREAQGEHAPTDPVSEVDHAIERLVRERLAALYPEHGIVGEEVEGHPDPGSEYLWVIDPVDGTTNFINGFPLFACSIGVLHRGLPVVGATWCSTGHALRPGVYHAHRGGGLSFDGEPIEPRPTGGLAKVRRGLSSAPGGSPGRERQWDHRTTGSAVIECAFVAAGIFQSALFWGLHIWDVAAGVVLVEAAGREAWVREEGAWRPFERFAAPAQLSARERERTPGRAPSLRDWRMPLVIGTAEATAIVRERSHRQRWRWWRMRRSLVGRVLSRLLRQGGAAGG